MKSFFAALLATLVLACPAIAGKWDEGGTLGETDRVASWGMATDENILASSADYLKRTTDPTALKTVADPALKEAATALAACMAKVTDTPGISINEAHPYVLQCIAGLKPDHPWTGTQVYTSSVPVTQEAAPATLTKEHVRAEVKALLSELDGFRNTATFKQCIYGCGKENPGKEWNARRKALQDQMTPELDMPVMLKAALGNLWSLGMAYGKGKSAEAKELRAEIEKGLRQ